MRLAPLAVLLAIASTLAFLALGVARESDPASFVPRLREPLVFERCHDDGNDGDVVLVGAFGDVLIHNPGHRQGVIEGFDTLFANVAPIFRAPDVTYVNVEGTIGAPFPKRRSTRENLLAYDKALAAGLASLGVDVASTANNHALDRGVKGVRQTRALLEDAGVRALGTDGADVVVTTVGRGLRIAWIACTQWTNIPDDTRVVLHCHRDRARVLSLIRAHARKGDVVIVTPHGGEETFTRADTITRALHHSFVDAGARVVIGNHPHRVQQWEKVTSRSDGHEAFVSSCNGPGWTAFKDGQSRTAAFLLIGLDGDDGRVLGVRYVPIEWRRRGSRYELAAGDGAPIHRVWSAQNEIAPGARFACP